MKLPVRAQILVTYLKLLSFVLYVPCNSRNMKLKYSFVTEEEEEKEKELDGIKIASNFKIYEIPIPSEYLP